MNLLELVPIPLLSQEEVEKRMRPTIELTGNGDELCFEGYFGRWFRSSEKAVRKAVADYRDDYEHGHCLSYNDLYHKLNIAETHVGDEFGYSPSEDYKSEMEFDIVRVPADEHFEGMDEEVIVIEPASQYSYPMLSYMEV